MAGSFMRDPNILWPTVGIMRDNASLLTGEENVFSTVAACHSAEICVIVKYLAEIFRFKDLHDCWKLFFFKNN